MANIAKAWIAACHTEVTQEVQLLDG